LRSIRGKIVLKEGKEKSEGRKVYITAAAAVSFLKIYWVQTFEKEKKVKRQKKEEGKKRTLDYATTSPEHRQKKRRENKRRRKKRGG